MTFWQRQQARAAAKFLRWRYEKEGREIPEPAELDRQADHLVDQARQIAKRTGRNVFDILKELVQDLKK
ncbi:MAG: hypothetical protein P8X55_17890 [Desulfosarcinaceae bacterium]